MVISLHHVNTKRSMGTVLHIINTYSNLVSEKTFYQVASSTYFIIKSENLGVAVGIIGYRPINHWCVEQINLVILPEFRHHGFGSEASKQLTSKLLGTYGKVFCTVNINNNQMLHIKENQGFVLEGILKDHFCRGRHIAILSKTEGYNETKIHYGKADSMR